MMHILTQRAIIGLDKQTLQSRLIIVKNKDICQLFNYFCCQQIYMAFKLILDFGNTLKKIAVFRGNDLLDSVSTTTDVINIVESYKKDYPDLKSAILSAVVNVDIHLISYLKTNFNFIFFNEDTAVPIENHYQTPKTLGRDRLAAAIAGIQIFPNKNILIIDAGSSITYEIVTAEGIYLGGAISPGIKMRAKALNSFTDKLPLVSTEDKTRMIGNTTENCLKSGIINGTIAEINGMISSYSDLYNNLKIILTGGDTYYFDKSLKYDIFASPNLVLQGLNNILDYNEH